MSKRNRVILAVVFLIAATFFSYFVYNYIKAEAEKRILLEKRRAAWDNLKLAIERKINAFGARPSVIIKDLATKWEIDFNKDRSVPAASLVKIPIMLSYFYAAQENKISLKEEISLKGMEKVSGSKVLGDRAVGSKFSVEELMVPMITQSDNTATNMLIDRLGFDTLNGYFKQIGLKNTNVSRRMMDFKKRANGVENYTTAEDMAFLLEELYRLNFLNKNTSKQCLILLAQQKVNDRIPRKLPKDDIVVAHKTGLERSVCHDVGIVFTNKGNFLICVLVKHGNKFARPAKKLIADIALLTYNYYQGLD
ncbi:MAG: class A beta-lactamase-related serine hydrolase [Candidatus Omnitrophica bacterium]|nr:class A beta-lactamase-related serine hydrolase [Candidatus Omnitrophota bacterium]MBU1869915.1 class A beta-lactamase-related serine hydrolase [Candidatus Omnitrophota bacterium]